MLASSMVAAEKGEARYPSSPAIFYSPLNQSPHNGNRDYQSQPPFDVMNQE
jgi:hypothetical protein